MQIASARIGMTGPPGSRIVRSLAGIFRRRIGTAAAVPT